MDKLEIAKLIYLKAWRLDKSIRAIPKPTDPVRAVRWAKEVERSKERVKRALERVAEVAEEGIINRPRLRDMPEGVRRVQRVRGVWYARLQG